jgi:hypothetical protein
MRSVFGKSGFRGTAILLAVMITLGLLLGGCPQAEDGDTATYAGSIVGTWQRSQYYDNADGGLVGEGVFTFSLNFKGSAASGPLDFWSMLDNNQVADASFTYTYNAPNLTFVDDIWGRSLLGRAVLSSDKNTLTISGFGDDPRYSDAYIVDGIWNRVK